MNPNIFVPIAAAFVLLSPLDALAQNAPAGANVSAPRGAQMRDVIAKLSPTGQQIFRTEWLANERQAMGMRRNAARSAEDGVFTAMAAEPFDTAALRHAYDVQRAVNANNQRQRHEHLVMVLSKLAPADRQVVVTALRSLREQHELK